MISKLETIQLKLPSLGSRKRRMKKSIQSLRF